MNEITAEQYWHSKSIAQLQKDKERVQHLIAREQGKVPRMSPVMPWMLPCWQKSLEGIEQVINEKQKP